MCHYCALKRRTNRIDIASRRIFRESNPKLCRQSCDRHWLASVVCNWFKWIESQRNLNSIWTEWMNWLLMHQSQVPGQCQAGTQTHCFCTFWFLLFLPFYVPLFNFSEIIIIRISSFAAWLRRAEQRGATWNAYALRTRTRRVCIYRYNIWSGHNEEH